MYSGYPYYYTGISSATYSAPSLTNVSSYPSYTMNYSSYSPPSLSISSISTNVSVPTTTTTTTTISSSSVVNTATTDSNINSTEINPKTEVEDSSKEASNKKKNKNPYIKR
jgi:hypothetical protein